MLQFSLGVWVGFKSPVAKAPSLCKESSDLRAPGGQGTKGPWTSTYFICPQGSPMQALHDAVTVLLTYTGDWFQHPSQMCNPTIENAGIFLCSLHPSQLLQSMPGRAIMRMNAVQMVVRLHCFRYNNNNTSTRSVQTPLFNIVNLGLVESAEVKPGSLEG